MRTLLIAYLFLIHFSIALHAQSRMGGSVFRIEGTDLYWAAVKTEYFVEYTTRQRNTNWCWAACAQMVLNYQGVKVSQERIVKRVFGNECNSPGTAYDIAKGANGWQLDNYTIHAYVENPNSTTPKSFINDLRDKYPLVVGLRMPNQTIGHAYVLTGISFRIKGNQYLPQEVILRDPWPENPSRLKLTWQDFRNRVHTIVHIYPK